jgi:ankyrin repeat protein
MGHTSPLDRESTHICPLYFLNDRNEKNRDINSSLGAFDCLLARIMSDRYRRKSRDQQVAVVATASSMWPNQTNHVIDGIMNSDQSSTDSTSSCDTTTTIPLAHPMIEEDSDDVGPTIATTNIPTTTATTTTTAAATANVTSSAVSHSPVFVFGSASSSSVLSPSFVPGRSVIDSPFTSTTTASTSAKSWSPATMAHAHMTQAHCDGHASVLLALIHAYDWASVLSRIAAFPSECRVTEGEEDDHFDDFVDDYEYDYEPPTENTGNRMDHDAAPTKNKPTTENARPLDQSSTNQLTTKSKQANCNHKGRAPLHYACDHDAPAVVILALLKAYPAASIATGSDRMTPLHVTCSSSHASVHTIRVLLEHGDPTAASLRDVDGDTPLHAACRCGASRDVLEVLLRANPAAVHERCHEGLTPLLRLWVRYTVIVGNDVLSSIKSWTELELSGVSTHAGQNKQLIRQAWNQTELLLECAYAGSLAASSSSTTSSTTKLPSSLSANSIPSSANSHCIDSLTRKLSANLGSLSKASLSAENMMQISSPTLSPAVAPFSSFNATFQLSTSPAAGSKGRRKQDHNKQKHKNYSDQRAVASSSTSTASCRKFRVVHAVAAVDCPRLVVQMACCFHPHQLVEKDENGLTPLLIAAQAPVYKVRDLSDDGYTLEDHILGSNDNDSSPSTASTTATTLQSSSGWAGIPALTTGTGNGLSLSVPSNATHRSSNGTDAGGIVCSTGPQHDSVLDILIRAQNAATAALAARISDPIGRLPLYWALETGKQWYRDGVKALVEVYPEAVTIPDPQTGLFPFQVASLGAISDLTTAYELLRRHPSMLQKVQVHYRPYANGSM